DAFDRRAQPAVGRRTEAASRVLYAHLSRSGARVDERVAAGERAARVRRIGNRGRGESAGAQRGRGSRIWAVGGDYREFRRGARGASPFAARGGGGGRRIKADGVDVRSASGENRGAGARAAIADDDRRTCAVDGSRRDR